MGTSMKSLPVRLSGALGIAALSLSFTFGGSYVVRAENPEASPPSLQDMVVTPIMRAVEGLEQRVASLEASVAGFAASFTSRHITTHELCVSDESGAQTCITKAQLDALLRGMAHAEVSQPSLAVSDAPPAAEAVETVATPEAAAAPEIAAAPETVAAPEIAEPATGPVADENAQGDQDPAQTGAIPAASPAPANAADESSRDNVQAPQTETATPASATETSVPDESSQNDQQPAQIEAATSVSAAATSVSEASSQEDQQQQAQAEAETETVTSSAPAPIPAPDAEISAPAPAPFHE